MATLRLSAAAEATVKAKLGLPVTVEPAVKNTGRDECGAASKARTEAHSLAIRLGALYPRCFPPNLRKYAPIAPLKTRIHKDIMARHPDIKRRPLGWVLSQYCHGVGYTRLMVPGAIRIDLDGAPAGIVTETESPGNGQG
jgi:hypothetical protein